MDPLHISLSQAGYVLLAVFDLTLCFTTYYGTRLLLAWLCLPRRDYRICICGCLLRHHEEDCLAPEGRSDCMSCEGCIMFEPSGEYYDDDR